MQPIQNQSINPLFSTGVEKWRVSALALSLVHRLNEQTKGG
jgi:hypothetical protein